VRKPSAETQLRTVKRELKEARIRYGAIMNELDERRRIGTMLSNICFNGKQCDRVPEDFRRCMASAQEAWDGIKGRK
jgi:hypothetical protein